MIFASTLRSLSVLTAGLIASAAFAANQSSNLPQELYPGPAYSDPAAALSRAEVQADLQLWQQAGLDRYSHGEGVIVDRADYERRLQRYQALRQGPAYQELVNKLQAGS